MATAFWHAHSTGLPQPSYLTRASLVDPYQEKKLLVCFYYLSDLASDTIYLSQDKKLEKYGYNNSAQIVEIPEQMRLVRQLEEMEEDADLYGNRPKVTSAVLPSTSWGLEAHLTRSRNRIPFQYII